LEIETTEERRYNAPTADVVMGFIPNDELGKDRCSFYQTKNSKYKQSVNDLNHEYDLLGYRNNHIG
jgi:hypothetical protein